MKNYEITFITSTDSKEEPVKAAIEKLDGKVLKSDFLGEKQFTYKIEKKDKGFYTTLIFEISPEKVADLNKALLLDEEIIRFLIISAERTDFKAPESKTKELSLEKPAGQSPLGGATTELEKEPEKALVVEENLPVAVKEEPKKTIKKEAKPEKKVAKKAKLEKKAEEKPAVKDKKVEEITAEEATEEERLKALDEKLDELLKD